LDEEFGRIWNRWERSPSFPEVVRRRALKSRRRRLSDAESAKAWYVTDANLFLQYKPFDQVDWTTHLGPSELVLVVPTAVLRALDRYKSDVDRPRLRERAQKVIPWLERYSLAAEPGMPAPVRRGVELLLLDREPPIPGGLDPTDPDDRIIAAALDFGQRYIGAAVTVLSGDTHRAH
jgi:hypothetical protein